MPDGEVMNVLVVEDDAEVGSYITGELDRIGYLGTVASDLALARGLLSNTTYDVVVLDRMLPDGDGLSFIEELRSSGNEIPVLVLSALGEVNHRVEGLRAGSDDYLVTITELVLV